MSNKRKQYSAEFKAKIALEAVKGEKSISEIASHYGVHPTIIHQWTRHLLDGAMPCLNRVSLLNG
jgi:transposase-like protein